MVTRNSKISKAASAITQTNIHPSWASLGDNSVFGYEMSIAADPSCHGFLPPNPLFTWLQANKQEALLFKALDCFCPLFPIVSDRILPSLYLSPPPSGANNTVGIVIGRDANGVIRAVGTNIMSNPVRSINTPGSDFFSAYDASAGNSLIQSRLIENEISSRMTSSNLKRSKEVEDEAFKFRTMPIYILVIEGEHSLIGMDVAVAYPSRRPTNLSREFLGEIL